MRDPKIYQIMVAGQPVKIADATREQVEQELMRALDVIQSVENATTKITDLVGAYIDGNKNDIVDSATAEERG